jgi:hypothetical protein
VVITTVKVISSLGAAGCGRCHTLTHPSPRAPPVQGTSNNSNALTPMLTSADFTYNQGQIHQILDKLDELIFALRR